MTLILQHLRQDLRYALRQLGRNPGFASIAVLTLALGIGANTAIFSLLDQALLRSLPIEHPEQLVVLEGTGDAWEGNTSTHGGDTEAYFSYPMYKDLRDHNSGNGAFQGLIGIGSVNVGISRNGAAQTGRAEMVSGNYFRVLGVGPAIGRVLSESDDAAPGASPIAVLSYDFWKDNFGADPSVVGQTVSLDGHPFQIVGVASSRYRSAVWGESPSLFVPMSMLPQVMPARPERLTQHTSRWMNILGRLKPGESRAQAETALAPLWHALRAEELKTLGIHSPRFIAGFLTNSRLLVLPGSNGFSYQRDDYRKPLLAIMGMALLVLLIASVNVASLLLVRSASRVREFALRYALGAGGGRILGQLLLEGLLIGFGGGVAGMLLAPFALRALVKQLADSEGNGAFTSSIDARLLAFNFAVAVAVSVVFSLAPALQLRRPDLTVTLGQKSSTGSGAMSNVRRLIVVLQIGLSVLLLAAAGLFVRTMQNLRHVDVGFNPTHLTTFGINPKLAGYAETAVPALHQRVLETLAALPGVQSVAATTDAELAGDDSGGNVTVGGYVPPPDDDFDVENPFVNPTYFAAMQIPLLAGRAFTEADTAATPKVAIVNESFARHFCGNPLACLGRMMASGGGNSVKLDTEIVGIARDAKHAGVREGVKPTWYRPNKQDPEAAGLYLYLRTAGDPVQELATVRRAMQQLDPSLALVALRTMDDQIDENLANDRLTELLAISFGALATLLAGIGLYGVLAYVTAQRTREIGVRIALGSSRIAISRIVLMDVLKLAGIGVVFAIPCSIGLARLLKSQLFGVSSADPVTFLAVILLVGLVAVVAALVPAHRAATVDPIEALRND